MAENPNARPALCLATVAALTSLTGPDVEQVTLMSPALAALGNMVHGMAVLPDASGALDPSRDNDRGALQSKLLLDLAALPAATG